MDSNGTLFENSRRLRFEAFSNLAIELNNSSTFTEICGFLLAYVKFIVESFVFTVNFRQGDKYLHIVLFRGEYTISQKPQNIYYDFFVHEFAEKNLPVTLTKEQILAMPGLSNTLYAHEKVKSAFILPSFFSAQHSITVGAASKNMHHYSNADFRFIKLISETLSSKMSQVLAQRELEQQTIELAGKNQEVTMLYQNLEEIVKERTRELTEANEELQTLFYRTSHDFRAPLTNIIGLVNIAEITDSEEDKRWVLQNCRQAIKHLDKMLYKLNSLSHIKAPAEVMQIDFKKLVKTAEEKCGQECNGTDAMVVFENGLNTVFRGNPAPFSYIFENLFENAVQYCTRRPVIHVKASNTFAALTLVVTDNGSGIQPGIINRVFDMYFRGDARSKGNGLGLYVVNKIIKLLNAQIKIESEVDNFTRITMSFPVKVCETYLEVGMPVYPAAKY